MLVLLQQTNFVDKAILAISLPTTNNSTLHNGLLSCEKREIDSVVPYVLKVTKSYESSSTMCYGFSMESRSLLHKVLPDTALDNFATMHIDFFKTFCKGPFYTLGAT